MLWNVCEVLVLVGMGVRLSMENGVIGRFLKWGGVVMC